MDAEGCLPPPHPHKALIFPFEFNEVTFCPVSSCKENLLVPGPRAAGRQEGGERHARGSGAPPGMAPTHLISKMTKALRGQVTRTGPHGHLVTRVVSLGLVLRCIKTTVFICVHPPRHKTLESRRLERKPILYGLKDRPQISISSNTASASLLNPASCESVFSPTVSQGRALNLLGRFPCLCLAGLRPNSQASLSNGVCLRGGWAGRGKGSSGWDGFLMAAASVLTLACHPRHSLEDTPPKCPLAFCSL